MSKHDLWHIFGSEETKEGSLLKGVVFIGSAKTDPVRFKWGFGEGLLKDKFAIFEASKNPKNPKRRDLLAKRAFLQAKRAFCLKRPVSWTGSVFPLLILGPEN